MLMASPVLTLRGTRRRPGLTTPPTNEEAVYKPGKVATFCTVSLTA